MANKKTLTVSTQGIGGGNTSSKIVGWTGITDLAEGFEIEVDCYKGAGQTYAPRETSKIRITFPNNEQMEFESILDLQRALNK